MVMILQNRQKQRQSKNLIPRMTLFLLSLHSRSARVFFSCQGKFPWTSIIMFIFSKSIISISEGSFCPGHCALSIGENGEHICGCAPAGDDVVDDDDDDDDDDEHGEHVCGCEPAGNHFSAIRDKN